MTGYTEVDVSFADEGGDVSCGKEYTVFGLGQYV